MSNPIEQARALATNLDVEQAVLTAMLHSEQAASIGTGMLSPQDFAAPAHIAIFEAVGKALQEGEGIDVRVLHRRVTTDPRIVEIGDGYLLELAGAMPNPAGLKGQAIEIKRLAQRRKAIDAAERMLEGMTEGDGRDTSDLVGAMIADLSGLDDSDDRALTKSQVAERLARRLESGGACYRTGLDCLDRAMGGGLYAGRSYGFEAMDKRGKTTLAGTVSDNLNAAGVKHAYVALEMGAMEIEQRNAARRMRIPAARFLGGGAKHDLAIQVGAYAAEVSDNTIFIDMPGGTFAELRSELNRARMRHGITGFVIDYWQLIEGRDKGTNLEEHLRRVAQWLVGFGRRYGLWSIILAQLNEEGFAFGSRRGLQMACDQVYIMHREPSQPWTWLEQRVSRYTPVGDVGSENNPALELTEPGPHFAEIPNGRRAA